MTASPRALSPLDVAARGAMSGSVLRRLDWVLLAVVAALVAVGTLLVW